MVYISFPRTHMYSSLKQFMMKTQMTVMPSSNDEALFNKFLDEYVFNEYLPRLEGLLLQIFQDMLKGEDNHDVNI